MKVSQLGSSEYILTSKNNSAKKNADFEKILSNISKGNVENKENLKKVCESFEGYLLNKLYSQMKQGIISINSDRSNEREIFEGMLDEKLMDEASKDNGIGLGEVLYKQLSKNILKSEK